MNINYKKHGRFPDSVLIREFKGKVNVDKIIESWVHLLKNKLISDQTLGIINDLTNCDLEMDFPDFYKLINYLKENNRLNKLKLAVISKEPSIVVFPTLGEYNVRELFIKPFSTEEAALNWIIYEL